MTSFFPCKYPKKIVCFCWLTTDTLVRIHVLYSFKFVVYVYMRNWIFFWGDWKFTYPTTITNSSTKKTKKVCEWRVIGVSFLLVGYIWMLIDTCEMGEVSFVINFFFWKLILRWFEIFFLVASRGFLQFKLFN